MNKLIIVISLILLGFFIYLFLGGMKIYESFTYNSVTFIAVPLADQNSPRATITYPNNDTKTLNFTLNNNTTTYNLTN